MVYKCLVMGKGIIVVTVFLLICKLIDILMNRFSRGEWKALYEEFKDVLNQIIEWILCLFIIGFCIATVFYLFYLVGCICSIW